MIPTLVSTEYLPTNAVPLDSFLPILGFAVAGLIVLVAFTYLAYSDDPFGAIFFVFIAMVVGVAPYAITLNQTAAQNQTNMIKNVKTAYTIDTIVFDERVSFPKSETFKVTITHEGKASRVLLTEDPETFEPSLASFENSEEIGKLKRNSSER